MICLSKMKKELKRNNILKRLEDLGVLTSVGAQVHEMTYRELKVMLIKERLKC